MDFLGEDFQNCFCIQHSLVRQWIHACSASVHESFWAFLLVWYRCKFPWSRLLRTTEFLQLLRKVIDVPGCRVVQVLFPVDAQRRLPKVQTVRDSPVRRHGCRFPCCGSCAVVEQTVEISQVPLLRNRSLPVVPVRLLTCPSVCNLLGRRQTAEFRSCSSPWWWC